MKIQLKTYLMILLWFISVKLFGQEAQIDSLEMALKTAKHDTTKCRILLSLIDVLPENRTQNYNNQLLEISKKNLVKESPLKKIYLKYYANGINQIGVTYLTQGDLTKALENFNESLKIQEQIDEKKDMTTTFNNIGAIYYTKGDISNAVLYFNRSLEIQKDIGDKAGISYSYNNIGSVYLNQGNIPKALENYFKCLNVREEVGDRLGIADILNNIGTIYLKQNDLVKALEFYNKSLTINEEMNDKNGIAKVFNNIASVYKAQGNLSNSLEYYSKSLKISIASGNKSNTAVSYINIGNIYVIKNEFEKAIEYYNLSLKIYTEIEDKRGIASSLSKIGLIYFNKNNLNKALGFSLKSMEISRALGYPENIKVAANILKKIYTAQGKYELALQNYELYIQMSDSISNQETRKASIKSQLKYEYEKKAAADSVKVAEEKKLTTVKLKQEQTQRYFLYGGLGLTILFGIFMFNRFRVTQKQKNIIEEQKLIVEHQKAIVDEKQKEILDSIHYAKRIQQSLLPTEKYINRKLRNNTR